MDTRKDSNMYDRKVPPSPLPKIWAFIKKVFKGGWHLIEKYVFGSTDKVFEMYKRTGFYKWWISLCEKYWIIHIIDRIIFWVLVLFIGSLFVYWFFCLIVIPVFGTVLFFILRVLGTFFLHGKITPPPFHIAEAYGSIWSSAIRNAFVIPWNLLKSLFGG